MLTKKNFLIIIIILAVLIFLLIIFFAPIFTKTSGWYAVHLSNGHIYFGQIEKISPETITLKETYFLETLQAQPSQNSQSESFQVETSPQQIYNLIKRGNRDNLMLTDSVLFINRSVVLFWEKLKPDSQVVKLIEKE